MCRWFSIVAIAIVTSLFSVGSWAQPSPFDWCIEFGEPNLEGSLNLCASTSTLPPMGEFWTTAVQPRKFASCPEAQAAINSQLQFGSTEMRFVANTPIITSVGPNEWHVEYSFSFIKAAIRLERPEWPEMTSDQLLAVDQLLAALGEHERGHAALTGHIVAIQSITETHLDLTQTEVEALALAEATRLRVAAGSAYKALQHLYDAVTQSGLRQDRLGGTPTSNTDLACEFSTRITLVRQEYGASALLSAPAVSPQNRLQERFISNDGLGTGKRTFLRRVDGVDMENINESRPPLGFAQLAVEHSVEDGDNPRRFLAGGSMNVDATELPDGISFTGDLAGFFLQIEGPASPPSALFSIAAGGTAIVEFEIADGDGKAVMDWACDLVFVRLRQTEPFEETLIVFENSNGQSDHCDTVIFELTPGVYEFTATGSVGAQDFDAEPGEVRAGSFTLAVTTVQ